MSKQTYKVCFCFRRRYRHTASVAPPEIKTIFDDYSDKGLMTVDHLLRFLTDVQKQEQATREEAQAIVNASSSLLHRNGLHLDAFFKYLLSVNNSPLAFHEVIFFIYMLTLCDINHWIRLKFYIPNVDRNMAGSLDIVG